MNVYIVKASTSEYDEHDSVVVVAESEENAIEEAMNAEDFLELSDGRVMSLGQYFKPHQEPLRAKKVDLNDRAVVHASFNAG